MTESSFIRADALIAAKRSCVLYLKMKKIKINTFIISLIFMMNLMNNQTTTTTHLI